MLDDKNTTFPIDPQFILVGFFIALLAKKQGTKRKTVPFLVPFWFK